MNAHSFLATSRRRFGLDVSTRGYQVLFHAEETNRCPGCGHAQWLVGRITAECCVCGTAIPLAEAERSDTSPKSARKAVALHIVGTAPAEDGREKRREPRLPAEGRTLALFVDGAPHPFAIHNISSGGLMGDALPGVVRAASLCVELEDGTLLPATLKWTDGKVVGLAFVSPTDAEASKPR